MKRVDFWDLGEASPVMDYGMPTRCWVRWNSQHSRNCVSLSSCWKPKSQEGNKSFVPELKKVISVSSVSEFLYIWLFHIFVFRICYNIVVVILYSILWNMFQLLVVYLYHGWKQIQQSFENQKCGWLKYYVHIHTHIYIQTYTDTHLCTLTYWQNQL